jgi:hypothetical protein
VVDGLDAAEIKKVEAAIREVDGVGEARVVTDAGRIDEIHIQANKPRSAKLIVRDIATLLITRFDLRFDHRKVSIFFPQGRPEDGGEPAAAPRLRHESVNVYSEGLRTEAQVMLSLGGRTILGSAAGASARDLQPRLIAEATLDAARKFLDEPGSLVVSWVTTVSAGTESVLVVSVRMLSGRQESTLIGGCLQQGDPHRSVVYATLDAINRVFGRFRLKEAREYELRPTSLL